MKQYNCNIDPTDFYLLRAPIFSIENFLVFNDLVYKKDILSIKKMLNDETFLKAIYLSSRYFYEVAVSWLQNDETTFDSKDKVLISLYKYYCRICTRSTPYGLFAGFSLGYLNKKKSTIEISNKPHIPMVRTDMLFLKILKDKIVSNEGKKKIIYYPNNTIYKIGQKLRFIAWNEGYDYEIIEVHNSNILKKIIDCSQKGIVFDQIIKIVENEFPEYDKNEIESYVNSIINSKLLVDCLPPYIISTKDPIYEVEKYLKEINIDTSSFQDVKIFLEHSKEKQNTNFSIAEMDSLANKYHKLLKKEIQLFQVDLKLNVESNNINEKVVQTLKKNAFDLLGISRNNNSKKLIEFCNRYRNKFEEREVPLIHALDPQLGVGYDLYVSGNVEETPLLKDINFSYKTDSYNTKTSPIIKLILEKYIDYLNPDKGELILSEQDINRVSNKDKSDYLSEDYYLLGDLYADSFDELDKGNFKFYCKSSWPSPFMGRILSRFSYHDNKLRNKLEEVLNNDTSSNFIHVEIVHCPNDKLGNVLLRPNFYGYEIPYVNESRVQNQNIKIDINDILIKVKGNEIVLRSKSLNKEIRPRLSSAYNYSTNQLSLIKFLCDLQYYKIYSGFQWDWSILNNCRYLPRVEYKGLILTEARWKVKKNDFLNIDGLKSEIKHLKIPQYCNLKDGDNVLLLDTRNEISLNIVLRKVKKHDIFLYESFHDSYFVSKDKKKYSTEFIFPLVRRNYKTPQKPPKKHEINKVNSLSVRRQYYVGDGWVYYKIYCSHQIGDKIIKEIISPLTKNCKSTSVWFFIRYEDVGHHIRLRMKTVEIEETTLLLKQLLAPLINDGLVFSLQMDTYKREIERYGVKNIELSEQLFCKDSIAVMELIKLLDEGSDEDLRWKLGIISIDMMLDDFQISVSERVILFQDFYYSFLPEFVNTSKKEYVKDYKKTINKKLRNYRQFLDNTIRLKDYSGFDYYIPPLKKRSNNLKSIISLIIKKNHNDKEVLIDLLRSYIHMTLNRIFPTKARMHELIIYYFMDRTYKSIINRNEG